jgi:conjugative relaxase-like TrwC/TraI family protein
MVSLTTIRSAAAAAHYFEKDNYYARDSKEALSRSHWWGEGATRLGLTGAVNREAFEAVLEGKLPNGVEIASGPTGHHRPGIDVTFSAPKSVSLLLEVGGDARLQDAHDRAVTVSLAHLEREAAVARKTIDGATSPEQTGNLVIARFDHDTSRALDPQTHTHAVILGVTQRADREWRALANEEIYRLKMTLGSIYRAELAREVQQLGYEIERTNSDGRWEIHGPTHEQLEHFSKRTQEINAAMAKHGLEGAKSAERAALLTRSQKQEVDRRTLRQEWQLQAVAQGIDLNRMITEAHQRNGRDFDRHETQQAAHDGLSYALGHLTERQSVVEKKDLIRHSLAHTMGQTTLRDLETVIRQSERKGTVIPVGDRRFTTLETLRIEYDTVLMMEKGKGAVIPILSRADAEQLLQTRDLTVGQQQAVKHILNTSDRFVGVEGKAGTGKTTMLAIISEYAERSGFEVRGLAISASAAHTLQEQAGIPSQTVSSFLSQLQNTDTAPQAKRTLYIIDEASLVGSRQAHALVKQIEREENRALFVGDRLQLASIEAGKPFAVLADRGMATVHMSEIIRQRDLDLRAMIERAAEGKAIESLRRLDHHGRITEITDRQERLSAVANEYLSRDVSTREQTLVLTGSRADRTALNSLIRNGLKMDGVLNDPEVSAEILVSRDLTKAQMREPANLATGDVIRFGKDYRQVGIERGEYGRVQAIHRDSNAATLVMERDGRTVTWQPSRQVTVEVYRPESREVQVGETIRWTRNDHALDRRNGELARVVQVDPSQQAVTIAKSDGERQTLSLAHERHWEHGYVSTVHSAQGRTTDQVIYHLVADSALTSRESWYVAISRARDNVTVFTDDRQALRGSVQRSREQVSAAESVEHSGAGDRARGLRDHQTADRHLANPPRSFGLER